MVPGGSVKLNCPGGLSVATPRMVQLLKGNERLVVVRTVKLAPGVFVKENWKPPFPARPKPVSKGGFVATTEIRCRL